MQLCGNMIKLLVYSHTKMHRFLSMLLLMLFLSISILQLAHTHRAPASDKENITSDSVSAIEKCEICDFIIHKQSKHLPASFTSSIIALSPVEITHNSNSCICNYEFALQGFTNKGPPNLHS